MSTIKANAPDLLGQSPSRDSPNGWRGRALGWRRGVIGTATPAKCAAADADEAQATRGGAPGGWAKGRRRQEAQAGRHSVRHTRVSAGSTDGSWRRGDGGLAASASFLVPLVSRATIASHPHQVVRRSPSSTSPPHPPTFDAHERPRFTSDHTCLEARAGLQRNPLAAMEAASSSAAAAAAAVPSKRVTYVIPPYSERPPRLELPDVGAGRHPSRPAKGSSYPLLRPHPDQDGCGSSQGAMLGRDHPRHALPVTSLAVDPSTSILEQGSGSTPRGILYTAGRDGLVASWQLNLKMRKRTRDHDPYRRRTRADDQDEESDWVFSEREEEEYQEGRLEGGASDSERPAPSRSASDDASAWEALPFEKQWTVDTDWLAEEERAQRKHPRSTFRSCVQSHTDWINDMLLCNMNQTGEWHE